MNQYNEHAHKGQGQPPTDTNRKSTPDVMPDVLRPINFIELYMRETMGPPKNIRGKRMIRRGKGQPKDKQNDPVLHPTGMMQVQPTGTLQLEEKVQPIMIQPVGTMQVQP